MVNRITLIKVRKGNADNVNEELQWLGNSLGLFTERDKDSSCFRIFITVVRKAKRNETMSSDQIAERLHLSRGTVVHHLTKLMNAGLVVREREGYILRERNLQDVVRSLRTEVSSLFKNLEEIGKDIDERLG